MQSLHDIGVILRRELVRLAHRPTYRMLLVVLPVLSFLFFAALFSGGVARDIPIALLDEDHTPLSRTLSRMVEATPTVSIARDITSMEEGERLMREGEILAIVQIPAQFEKQIYAMQPTHVEAYVSGVNVTVNGLVSKDLQTAVQTFAAGIQRQQLMKQGLTEHQAMAQLMPVRFERHVLFNPYLNYGYYLAPSFMPMMLMIFAVLATIYAVGAELRYATAAEWLHAARGSLVRALIGKLLPVTFAMVLVAMAMFAILFQIVDVPLNGSLAVLLLGTLLFILAYQSIGVMILAVTANLRLALSLGGGYSVLAFTFSGLTFPLMAMWLPMQWLSHAFPFTFYTNLFIDQLLRGAPVVCSLPDLGALALFAVVPLVALPRLRRICTEERYWKRL